jgi:Glycosyltransferase 61
MTLRIEAGIARLLGRRRAAKNAVALSRVMAHRLTGRQPPPIESVAERSWEISPAVASLSPRAVFLPGQLDRVTGWAFSDGHPGPEMQGGIAVPHAPTLGFILRHAWLVDGRLYKDGACCYLQPRSSRWPQILVEQEIERAAIFCTSAGNRYFGQWLMDDCVTYPLAASEGVPVTTDQPVNLHTLAYEDWLGMKPERVQGAFLREAVIFQDIGQNRDKHRRFRAMSDRLLSHVEVVPHPGVFILRGTTGDRRCLQNELELAERLRDRRGFRIIDPAKSDVATIVRTCAGARTVVGVEGSGLIHGVLVLRPGGSLLTLQPPNRFVPVFKHLTDRDDQNFGFVVGLPRGGDFWIDPEEVERTLDLLPL